MYVWPGTRGSEGGQVAGSCEQGNEPRVSIKVANFFSRWKMARHLERALFCEDSAWQIENWMKQNVVCGELINHCGVTWRRTGSLCCGACHRINRSTVHFESFIRVLRPSLFIFLRESDLSDWSNNHPTKQPTNQPTNQPTHQPINQPTNQSTNQDLPNNQPTNQSTNQPTN